MPGPSSVVPGTGGVTGLSAALLSKSLCCHSMPTTVRRGGGISFSVATGAVDNSTSTSVVSPTAGVVIGVGAATRGISS